MAALPLILTVASTAFTVVGAMRSASAESAAAKANARQANQNALQARQQAAADVERQRRIAGKTLGAMRANYSASGVTLEGTPLDVIEESAAQAKLDELNIKHNGELQALGYQNTASLDRARAKSAKTSGYAQAGSALLIGGAKSYDAYKAYKGE